MSIFGILAIVILIALIFGGLYISRWATLQQMEQQELRSRIRQRRVRLGEIEELFQTLLIYDRNTHLLETLQLMLVHEAQTLIDMAPQETATQRDFDYYQGLSERIAELGDLTNNPEIPLSDRQINLVKRHFGRTVKLLRMMTGRGEISELESVEHIQRLRRNSLMLEVEAYKQQGLQAKRNADYSSAASYFKHAKDLLAHTELNLDDKNQQIRTISRMISSLYSSEYDEEIEPASDNDNQSASDKA